MFQITVIILTFPCTRILACHWFFLLEEPTPMKREVRCLELKRLLGTLALSLFKVAFTSSLDFP